MAKAVGFSGQIARQLVESLNPSVTDAPVRPGVQLKSLFVRAVTTITAASTLGAGSTLGSGTVRACKLELVSGSTYQPVEISPAIEFDISSERLTSIAAGQYFSVEREEYTNRWHVC